MSTPQVVSSHVNSEGEYASIERVTAGPFAGQFLLVIHDDPPLSLRAPMLLDEGTVAWLRVETADFPGGPTAETTTGRPT